MSLSNFFRINMPYGIAKNKENKGWMAFNREYMPIGFNTKDGIQPVESRTDIPIFTEYFGLTEKLLAELANSPQHLL